MFFFVFERGWGTILVVVHLLIFCKPILKQKIVNFGTKIVSILLHFFFGIFSTNFSVVVLWRL